MTLVAIGASAGGPGAIATILRELPADFPAAIIIVQHIDADMAIGMANWLSTQTPLPVRAAQEGDRPSLGTALVAATEDHLILKGPERVGYTCEPVDYAYRPSVDAFFESVHRHWQGNAVGVLLSGMGGDGAKGLKALRDQGRYTIAQDQQTSAVYGMPKAAARLEAAVDILPVERIATALIAAVSHSPR
jgi:two-component system, chemotaxis family, response regulator WspF